MTGRKLGRGLDMLIAKEARPVAPVDAVGGPGSSSPASDSEPAAPHVEEAPAVGSSGTEVLDLEPSRITLNPDQPRKRFALDELEHLKTSIEREGVLQPLVVRRVGEEFQLVAGERRLRAAQELGLKKVPAIAVAVGDERLLELALIENIQREDLNPVELASAFRRLMSVKGWTQEALAQALSLARPTVANVIRILDLPEDMRHSLARGHITLGHAKALLAIPDPREQRLYFEKIAEEKLTVRDLEGIIEEKEVRASPATGERKGKKARPKTKKPHILSLEERFSERLGTKVRIHERNGRGRITIDFYSPEEFERIREAVLMKT